MRKKKINILYYKNWSYGLCLRAFLDGTILTVSLLVLTMASADTSGLMIRSLLLTTLAKLAVKAQSYYMAGRLISDGHRTPNFIQICYWAVLAITHFSK